MVAQNFIKSGVATKNKVIVSAGAKIEVQRLDLSLPKQLFAFED
jgi:hypothetical protein